MVQGVFFLVNWLDNNSIPSVMPSSLARRTNAPGSSWCSRSAPPWHSPHKLQTPAPQTGKKKYILWTSLKHSKKQWFGGSQSTLSSIPCTSLQDLHVDHCSPFLLFLFLCVIIRKTRLRRPKPGAIHGEAPVLWQAKPGRPCFGGEPLWNCWHGHPPYLKVSKSEVYYRCYLLLICT